MALISPTNPDVTFINELHIEWKGGTNYSVKEIPELVIFGDSSDSPRGLQNLFLSYKDQTAEILHHHGGMSLTLNGEFLCNQRGWHERCIAILAQKMMELTT